MALTNPLSSLSTQLIKVWVLAPHLVTSDANIEYYYDFTQSIAEYEKTFAELGIEWKWQPVTIKDYETIIETIAKEKEVGNKTPVVFNLCDGDEVNGTPGISVVRLLDEKGLLYTGADEYFYNITTSKIPMKKAFDKAKVPSAKWEAIVNKDQNLQTIFENLGTPVIVKPAISGGSMGVGIKNVVHNQIELKEQVDKMFAGYRGWDLVADGLIAEAFITGPEFTVLISGSYNNPKDAKIYTPVERVFHASLPEEEKFLSFDRLWEIYEEETPMPNDVNFYEYALPDALLMEMKGFNSNDFAKYHPGGTLGKKLYLRVADIAAQNEKPKVLPTATIKEVIVEMTEKRLGAAVVVNEAEEILGIITDGDLRRMLEKTESFAKLQAKDIMSSNPKTIAVDVLAVNALEEMRRHNISQLIAVDNKLYAGIIHLHDLVKEGII